MSPVPDSGFLTVNGLSARYATSQVLSDVELTASRTGVVAILGRNGAGKTTLLNCIAGVHRPAAGQVWIAGRDTTVLPTERIVKLGVGYVPQEHSVFPGLTVRENLLIGAMAGARTRRPDLDGALALFPRLAQRLGQPAGTLSGGERKMLAIGRALLGDPALLLLDEPTEGVWPTVVEEIADRLSQLAATRSVILVEQHIDFALRLAERVYVMDRGRVVLNGTAAEIRDHSRLLSYVGV